MYVYARIGFIGEKWRVHRPKIPKYPMNKRLFAMDSYRTKSILGQHKREET